MYLLTLGLLLPLHRLLSVGLCRTSRVCLRRPLCLNSSEINLCQPLLCFQDIQSGRPDNIATPSSPLNISQYRYQSNTSGVHAISYFVVWGVRKVASSGDDSNREWAAVVGRSTGAGWTDFYWSIYKGDFRCFGGHGTDINTGSGQPSHRGRDSPQPPTFIPTCNHGGIKVRDCTPGNRVWAPPAQTQRFLLSFL